MCACDLSVRVKEAIPCPDLRASGRGSHWADAIHARKGDSIKTDPQKHSQRDLLEVLHLEQREGTNACMDSACEGQRRHVPWIRQAADNRYMIGMAKRRPLKIAIVHMHVAICAAGILRTAHIMSLSWSPTKFEAYALSRIIPLV